MSRTSIAFAAALSGFLVLAACESSEERAEKHFQAALELIEEGDADRAIIELRNVFQLDGTHREARRTFARLQRERGNEDAAFGQYLRLVEQYPDDFEGLQALSEIAVRRMDWDSVRRFAPRALERSPDDLQLRSMSVLVKYLDARQSEDDAAANEAVAEARKLAEALPDDIATRQVLLDQLLREERYSEALEAINILLEQRPDNLVYHETKLRILGSLQDITAMGTHLETMIEQFPDNERIRGFLISYYVNQGQLESAEAFLRKLADEAEPTDQKAAETTLVQFVNQTRGADAAIAELDRMIESREDTLFHRTLRAALTFEQGNRDAAITALRDAIEGQEQSIQLSDSKATLAQMLLGTGDSVGARALVEEVLEADQSHVAALQMRAAWMIEDDRASEATQVLRSALNQDPRNPRTLTLAAQAHLREGNRELAGERLSLAVEASNSGADESIQYARFLVDSERLDGAEQILLASLRQNETHLGLLEALGKLYLLQSDWIGADGVVRELRRLDTAQSRAIANGLQNELLLRQGRTEESTALLQKLAEEGQVGTGASALVVQNMLRDGDVEGAETYLEERLAKTPQDRTLRLIRAGLHSAKGELDAAETIFRTLIDEAPRDVQPYMALYSMLRRSGRPEEATALLDQGIEATDGNVDMRFAKASELEKGGDHDGAIAIYEDLYAQNTGSTVLANNLASMITTYRDDEESLQRAAVVAQRLRGSDVPAFQDTYGWIEYRRGNIDSAIEYLEPAAAGLPNDPMVQMHLGLAYVAAERFDDARTSLTRALEIAGTPRPPRLEQAQAALDALPEGDADGKDQ